MATLKCALRRKNASGTYDVLALQGASDITYRPSGRTVEQDLNAYLPSVQSSDTVPNTLAKGKILTGNNKAWFGNSANKAVELVNFSHLSSMFKTITNPPRTPANDTVENWRACGTGLAFYEVSGQLIDQPTRYGCVLNFVYSSTVFQLWLPCHQTIICYRTGANNGWWNNANHSATEYGYWVRTVYQISGNYDGVPNGTRAEKIPYSNLYLTAPVSRRNRSVMTLYEGDGAGDALAIDGAGLTIIGGGESSRTMMARLIQRDNLRAGDERLYVCSDYAIYFVTNVNTIQSDVSKNTHVTSVLDSTGKLTLPGGITAKFVNCPGGTLTAGLTTRSIIVFTEDGKTAEGWMIPFIFKMKNYETRAIHLVDGDNYGCGLILETGGTTILSGGEAGTNLMRALIAEGGAIAPSTEAAYVASDGNVYVCTGCQPIANRKTFTFGSDGSLTVPGAIKGNVTGNCSGSSSSCTGNAASATKLKTARNIQVNLASTSAASFNGTGNATPGISGTLAVGHGGTGLTNLVNTAYTTQQVRGIAFATSTPSSVPNGEITLVYG